MNKRVQLFILIGALIALAVLIVGDALLTVSRRPAGTPTEALSIAVNQTAVPAGPQIVGQSPFAGQRLPLAPVIALTFDREMDQAATEGSWSFTDSDGQAVAGTITWPDARTFQFQPSAKLTPGADYTAAFSTAARGLDGTEPSAAISLPFRTVDALAVGQVFPADGAGDVEPSTTVTVIFNQPVVPVTVVEESASQASPITISPAVQGSGEWVSSSVYVFTPDGNLANGTEYTVNVPAGLADTSGGETSAEFLWRFTTRAPKIGGFALKGGDQNPSGKIGDVLLDQAFIINFLQPMDPASTAAATSIVNRETGVRFPVSLKWDTDYTNLTVEPVGRYTSSGNYTLAVDPSAKAAGGGTLQDGLSVNFSTVGWPQVRMVYPENGSSAADFDSSMWIAFSTPMKLDSLKNKVKITPAPAKPVQFVYDSYHGDYGWKLYVYGLEPATDYIVHVLPGAADIYGRTTASDYSFTFRTGNISPYGALLFPYSPLVYRAKGQQDFFFEYNNLNTASISLYSLSVNQFGSFLNGDNYPGNFFPASAPIRTWNPKLEAAPNALARLRIALQDGNGDKLAPGYYFLGLRATPFNEDQNFHQGVVFTVASDNLSFKATDTEALAWLTDLETGKPSAGVPVTFYNDHFQSVGSAISNADGLAYLRNATEAVYAAAGSADRAAFTGLYWGSGVSVGDFGISQSYYNRPEPFFSYVYTDRPLYRPGQEVDFTGTVRASDDLHYSLPTAKTAYVVIDYWEEEVFAESMPLSDAGSFAGSFPIDPGAQLGTYNLMVYDHKDGNIIGSVDFRVADYRKPEFQVGVTSDKTDILPGDTVNFHLNAAYYSGGNVAGAGVSWFLEASPFYFNPPAAFQRYSFMDWDQDSGAVSNQTGGTGFYVEGTGTTGPDGGFDLSQVISPGKTAADQSIAFNANVSDVSGSLVSGGNAVVLHQCLLYAGIRARSYVGVAGEEQTFDLAVLDWQGNPVAGQAVSVSIMERQWYSVQQENDKGQLQWVTTVKDLPQASFPKIVTDADGKASVPFTPKAGGVYRAVVAVRDSLGNTRQASTYLWVSGDSYIPWRQTNDRSFNLVADKDAYAPGDTAELLIAQPFEGDVYALVTYERGHIYQQKVVLLHGNSTVYKLPITADMAPMAYVSVTVVKGTADGTAPDFRIGMARIAVDTSAQTLEVSVTPDKTAAGPGDDVTYTVITRDSSGKPVSAEVSLALVDKAVLALAPSNVSPILDAFYPVKGLSVQTALGLVNIADDFLANIKETTPTGELAGSGGGGEGKGSGDLGVVTVRQSFKDTAYWRAQLTTDSSGRAQVTVTLPENLTTWRMDVRAVTDDSRVGQAFNEIVSSKPLFVDLQTPRFFVSGDRATIGAVVHNNGPAPLAVNVSLTATGLEIGSAAAQTVTVEGGRQAYVTWNVSVAAGATRADLTVNAASGPYADAAKPALGSLSGQGIPVYSYTVIETVGTSGLLTAANSAVESFQLPTSFGSTGAALDVDVSPSLAASLVDGLTYLRDYPYTSMEGTVSSFLPNVITARVLEKGGITAPSLMGNLDTQVSTALQKIYAGQNWDGGWSWWQGLDSDPQTSAYVLLGLLEARDAGYIVKDSIVQNAVDYLANNMPQLGTNDPTYLFNRQAFVEMVLARAGSPQDTEFLYANRQSLGVYGEAFLAQAMFLADPQDDRIRTLVSDFGNQAVISAAGAHWEEKQLDYWNWNTDERTSAILLNTLVQIDPSSPLLPQAVRWLMVSRDQGRWASTQETAWSLMALANWLEASGELETDYAYAVGLNGQLAGSGTATHDNLTDPLHLTLDLPQSLAGRASYLVLTRGAGPGTLYYTAYLRAALPVPSVQALDRGMTVTRQYFTLDDPKHAITTIARGELVRVRLTLIVPDTVHFVVVNDPLPAGLEAIDSSLDAGVAIPDVYTRDDFSRYGWGWWYFQHSQVYDEKIVLSSDELPPGTYVYTYMARASTAGVFNVIPATAEEVYFPDVSGRSAGSTFTVTP